MKKIILILVLAIPFYLQAQENKYIDINTKFVPNEVVYTFGDNVKLRSEPNTNSEIYLEIPIAEKLTILEKTEDKLLYNGIDWNWYKVKYKDRTGYVLGGLLSQDSKQVDDDIYLISLKKVKDKLYILIRLSNDKTYLEHTNSFYRTFSIKVFKNRGVPNIKNMIYIDYLAESCGENGGGYYLFNDGVSLKKVIELNQVGDGGYWFYEEIFFPNDKKGIKGKIYFEREKGAPINDDDSQTISTKFTRELKWEGKEFKIKSPKEFEKGAGY